MTGRSNQDRTRPATYGLGVIAAVAMAMLPVALGAHVSIWPRESAPGATEKYVLRIPSEGKVATTKVDLEVPEGVVVETIGAPAGFRYTATRRDERIVAISWDVNVAPGEFIEVAFVARNPRGTQSQIVWTLRQHFSDGTMSDWTKAPNGSIRPTAITKLLTPAR